MKLVTEIDMNIMDQQDNKTLAEWSNKLNVWGWPEELPDDEGEEYIPNGRRSQLMKEIESRVGAKLISRLWCDWMTDDEHEEFWLSPRNI